MSILFTAIGCAAAAQTHVPIKGTKNIRLTSSLENAVSIGGVKDQMRCDVAGDIYTPVNRGYSSAFGSIVEIMADGKHSHSFSLDGVSALDTGHIEDFDVADDGHLYALVCEVTKYSDLQVPVVFGSTYILRFSSVGTLENQTKLAGNFDDRKPTALAVLKGGDFLVASYSYWPDKTVSIFADLFSADGSLKRKSLIPSNRTQASNGDTVSSMSVVRPLTIKSGGVVFVLRGSTRDPIYSFSETGELVRTIRLHAQNIEFSSPNVYGQKLLVHQHRAARASGSMLNHPELDVFPLFDLDSGALLQPFEWRTPSELACYDQDGLTVVQQSQDYDAGDYWAIIKAQPVTSLSSSPKPADADISLQLRWIILCDEKQAPFRLRGDDAARQFCLSRTPIVDDSDIDSASIYVNTLNDVGLRLTFTTEGSQKLRQDTAAHQGSELGVVINGELVLNVYVVESLEHEAVFTGAGLNREELSDWATRLSDKARRRTLRNST